MSHDALNRRLRHAVPQASCTKLVPTAGDYLVFEALDRHGPLPTHYLHELTRHARGNLANLKYRLTHFYNGTAVGPLLLRPPQQFAAYEARYQHLVHDLALKARLLLAERGTLSKFPPRRGAPFLHQLMQACVGASIEITARSLGLRYISRAEILRRGKGPDPLPLPLPSGNHALIPDDLFGLHYPGAGYRFFAVEIDRNTESIERTVSGQTSFGKKVAGYLAILNHRLHQEQWGVPNLTVLTVTTNRVHAANMLDFVRAQGATGYGERFLFVAEPQFGANWRVPREVLTHLLTEPWDSTTGAKSVGAP